MAATKTLSGNPFVTHTDLTPMPHNTMIALLNLQLADPFDLYSWFLDAHLPRASTPCRGSSNSPARLQCRSANCAEPMTLRQALQQTFRLHDCRELLVERGQ